VARDCSAYTSACAVGFCNEAADQCEGQPKPLGTDCGVCAACDDAGACLDDLSQDQDCPLCQECAPGSACTNQPAGSDVKVECDDALFCNGLEACDGAGFCLNGPDPCPGMACIEANDSCETCLSDGDCPPGNRCGPDCSPGIDGCVQPPEDMTLECDDPVPLPTPSNCTLKLNGGDAGGQESCLSCFAEVGPVSVDFSDFDDGEGDCDLDGWSLEEGEPFSNCSDRIDFCMPTGQGICCDDFSNICTPFLFGGPVLLTTYGSCGESGEWRLWKDFDFEGLTDLTVCFDLAQMDATTGEGILVYAEDPNDGSPAQLFCRNGDDLATYHDEFGRYCASLPAWADGNPGVKLTFVMHSSRVDAYLVLRNIEIEGWLEGCSPTTHVPLDENFEDCELSAWTVNGCCYDCVDYRCGEHPEWDPGMRVDSDDIRIETSVDVSELDGEVEVCIRYGAEMMDDDNSFVELRFDDGTGFGFAWSNEFPFGYIGCTEHCVNLSEISPAVNNNPSLGIRIRLKSNEDAVFLYGVMVRGAEYCPADAGVVRLSSPLVENGTGDYDFTATDMCDLPLSAKVRCAWDLDTALNASAHVTFVP
jgi:hypothetical protein